jgi:ribosomal protein S18 acetylase RimI-like enzyme
MRQIVPASGGDAQTLGQVIADAFHDLPPATWLIADQHARRAVFPGYFRLLVDVALTAGTVDTIPGRLAAALWLPVTADGPGPLPAGYPALLAQATGPYTKRFAAFDTMLDRHHPTGTAHEYLAILAVHPTVQGQGIGTALLRHHHTVLGNAGTPAYLEASALRNFALYTRHGYLPVPGAPFHLPGNGPPLWPMWRPPPTPAG